MNNFITTVMINNLAADYHIFRIGRKFKAMLVEKHLAKHIPYQLDFWKENGQWRTHHPLTAQVVSQFGNYIDHHMQALETEHMAAITASIKNSPAAIPKVANS